MKRLWTCGVGLSLGLLVGSAPAEELQWRPATPTASVAILSGNPTSAPAVTLGRAVPLAAADPSAPPASVASLGRPVPLAAADNPAPILDRQVRPTSLSGFAADQPLVRAKAADSTARPMPMGIESGPGMPMENPTFSASVSPPFQGPMPTPVPGPVGTVPHSGFGPDCGCSGGPDGCGWDVCCPGAGPCDGPICCGMDACCGAPQRPGCFWVSAEVLGWALKDMPAPPLLVSSPAGTPLNQAGIVGLPFNQTLLGGTGLNNEEYLGGRFTVGVWLDKCQTIGLEGSYMFLGQRSNSFIDGSGGNPILARPFIDSRGFLNSELVAFPNVLTGGVTVSTNSQLWGAEANVRYHLWDGCLCNCPYYVDLLGGFRFLELKEGLAIQENLQVPAGATVARATGPASIIVLDQFKTNNQFYGGQLGLDTEFHKGCWFLNVNTKAGIGTVHQAVDINGRTSITAFGTTTTSPGGLLAQPTNIGHWAQNRFGVMSAIGVKLGYQYTEHLRLFVGYDFLWLNNVVRPGDAIDQVVNVSQLPSTFGPGTLAGAPRPAPIFRESDFWAQGVSFGLELRY